MILGAICTLHNCELGWIREVLSLFCKVRGGKTLQNLTISPVRPKPPKTRNSTNPPQILQNPPSFTKPLQTLQNSTETLQKPLSQNLSSFAKFVGFGEGGCGQFVPHDCTKALIQMPFTLNTLFTGHCNLSVKPKQACSYQISFGRDTQTVDSKQIKLVVRK